jgi:hypothetical protein
MARQPMGLGHHLSEAGTMTLSILAGLLQIICVEAVVGAAVVATSLWWAACQRLSNREGE